MIELTLHRAPAEFRRARNAVRTALAEQGAGTAHASDVAAVVDELVGAARAARITNPLFLTITIYTRMTSVRVRCDRDVDLRDQPFEVRERLLGGLTFAFGRRSRVDGSVDLWAEVLRSD